MFFFRFASWFNALMIRKLIATTYRHHPEIRFIDSIMLNATKKRRLPALASITVGFNESS
ncbi:hypothetical protein CA600_15490 [Paenibacillus sp. VTT E-133280]|uniref:hypothetical protein n=1 Tax=Paenibacillus sp. VTT E-133280 TaxID=1986222 RepID=UPI000BA17757|nr:hypothetical protein [Paenibacillus sp. VTT E-133280]OZQ64973.1 hypothetical protein CA600_15490 [Paenibacillus sp. VTT E-133280]